MKKSKKTIRPERKPHSNNQTRRIILECATHLIGEKGFEGVSMRDIADRAGINMATIYYHFHDKESLCEQVARESLEYFSELIAAALRTGEPRTRLKRSFSIVIESTVNRQPERLVVNRLMSESSDRMPSLVNSKPLAGMRSEMKRLVAEVAPEVEGPMWAELAGLVLGLPHGVMRLRSIQEEFSKGRQFSPSELADVLANAAMVVLQAAPNWEGFQTPGRTNGLRRKSKARQTFQVT